MTLCDPLHRAGGGPARTIYPGWCDPGRDDEVVPGDTVRPSRAPLRPPYDTVPGAVVSSPSVDRAPAAPALPSGGSRLRWVDAARGVCVVLVVLFHVGLLTYEPFADTIWGPAERGWFAVSGLVGALRMPLLLAISGMLASRRIQQGWGRPGAAVRAASTYYLYVVWLLIHSAIFAVVGGYDLQDQIGVGPAFLLELALPVRTFLWYIFALTLYVVVFTTIRRVPATIVLPVLFVLGVVLLALDLPDGLQWVKLGFNAVWFGVGVYGAPLLGRLGDRRRIRDIPLFGVVAVVLVALNALNLAQPLDALIQQTSGLAFIALGCVTVANLTRWSPFARVGEYVGRRTLQIYVLHIPLAEITPHLVGEERMRTLLASPVIATLWPLVLTVLFVVLSLWIRTALEKVGLGVLFAMPAGITRRIEGAYDKRGRTGRHAAGRHAVVVAADPADGPVAAPAPGEQEARSGR